MQAHFLSSAAVLRISLFSSRVYLTNYFTETDSLKDLTASL